MSDRDIREQSAHMVSVATQTETTRRSVGTQTEPNSRDVGTQTMTPGQMAFQKFRDNIRKAKANPPPVLTLDTKTQQISQEQWEGRPPSTKALFVHAALTGKSGSLEPVRVREDSLTVGDIVDVGKLRGSEIGVATDKEAGLKVIGGQKMEAGGVLQGVAASVAFRHDDSPLFHTHPTLLHRDTSEFNADVKGAKGRMEFAVNQSLEAVPYDDDQAFTKTAAGGRKISSKDKLGVDFLSDDSSDPRRLAAAKIHKPMTAAKDVFASQEAEREGRAEEFDAFDYF